MAIYRPIQISFWQDTFVLELTPEEKYFYMYLLTNSKTTQCGIYEVSLKLIELETGYNSETVQKLINNFVKYDKIKYCKETHEVMIVNWIKHNPLSNVNLIKCVVKELRKTKNKELVREYIGACKGLVSESEVNIKPLPSITSPSPSPISSPSSSKTPAPKEKKITVHDLGLKHNSDSGIKYPADFENFYTALMNWFMMTTHPMLLPITEKNVLGYKDDVYNIVYLNEKEDMTDVEKHIDTMEFLLEDCKTWNGNKKMSIKFMCDDKYPKHFGRKPGDTPASNGGNGKPDLQARTSYDDEEYKITNFTKGKAK